MRMKSMTATFHGRLLAMVLATVFILSLSVVLPAHADNVYTINGKTVYATIVADPGEGQCWAYANSIYEIIWGTRFDSGFTGDSGTGYNMLRNLGDDDRALTAEHLKNFIGQAALGAST